MGGQRNGRCATTLLSTSALTTSLGLTRAFSPDATLRQITSVVLLVVGVGGCRRPQDAPAPLAVEARGGRRQRRRSEASGRIRRRWRREACLQLTDDLAEEARREQAGAERAGVIDAERREPRESRA